MAYLYEMCMLRYIKKQINNKNIRSKIALSERKHWKHAMIALVIE